jgi:transcriptional regulator with PAS, ATPase and Fis domain
MKPPTAEYRELKRQLEMYELIFDSIYNGAIVTDADGRITHFNRPYGQFLDIDPRSQIGRHCTETVENSRMHLVARTGRPEINQSHFIRGQNMVVQRIPIFRDGKVIGVFGQVMFKDVREVGKLARDLALLESKVKLYEAELISLRSTRYTFESIIGPSPAIQALKKEAQKAAANHFPVLISGESGTGKELFAQAIHHASRRKIYPFVRINCAAIPRDLLESELFGYEKGAFTGARTEGKPGKFELAHRGTIFLDEIGDLPIEMQPKLLRAIEDREFERIGGTRPIRSDFRIIAATNQDLKVMLADGRFRKDLFYRLNVIPLYIPPLGERRIDILPITRHCLARLAQETGVPEIELDGEARRALLNHDWHGNVRELINVLERVVANLEGDTIRLVELPFYLHPHEAAGSAESDLDIRSAQQQAEREAIRQALTECGYNKSRAARMLGIHRTHLYKKMKRHGIPVRPR